MSEFRLTYLREPINENSALFGVQSEEYLRVFTRTNLLGKLTATHSLGNGQARVSSYVQGNRVNIRHYSTVRV